MNQKIKRTPAPKKEDSKPENKLKEFKILLKERDLSLESTPEDIFAYVKKIDEKAKKEKKTINARLTKYLTIEEERIELKDKHPADWPAALSQWIEELSEPLRVRAPKGSLLSVQQQIYNSLSRISNELIDPETRAYSWIIIFPKLFFGAYEAQDEKPKLPMDLFLDLFLRTVARGVELANFLPKLKKELKEMQEGKSNDDRVKEKTIKSEFNAEQLTSLYAQLVKGKYITQMKNISDFISQLSGQPKINSLHKIHWKASKSKLVYLLDKISPKFLFPVANSCFKCNGKKLDSNDRPKNGYEEIDTILKQIR